MHKYNECQEGFLVLRWIPKGRTFPDKIPFDFLYSLRWQDEPVDLRSQSVDSELDCLVNQSGVGSEKEEVKIIELDEISPKVKKLKER